jgi:phosphoribosylglycinamide formyltransferase-1
VHFVTADLDGGPNIAQASVKVFSTDTPETLAARVLESEHRIYPAALKRVAEGQAVLVNGAAKFFGQKKGH